MTNPREQVAAHLLAAWGHLPNAVKTLDTLAVGHAARSRPGKARR